MAMNTENSTHTNRLNDISSSIEGARKAIQLWEDKRTEAMIDLDALAYDIRMLEEEKNKAYEIANQYKAQLKNQEKLYRTQVEAFSDQLQEAKLEIEKLRDAVRDANTENALIQNELQNQIQMHKNFEAEQVNVIANAKAELEIELSDLKYQYQNKTQEITEQLQAAFYQKSEAQEKVDHLEQELQSIRSQMMSALKVNDVPTSKAANANLQSSPMLMKKSEVSSGSNINIPDAVIAQKTEKLEDYLKRLGY